MARIRGAGVVRQTSVDVAIDFYEVLAHRNPKAEPWYQRAARAAVACAAPCERTIYLPDRPARVLLLRMKGKSHQREASETPSTFTVPTSTGSQCCRCAWSRLEYCPSGKRAHRQVNTPAAPDGSIN